jgi:hypothetical protein
LNSDNAAGKLEELKCDRGLPESKVFVIFAETNMIE